MNADELRARVTELEIELAAVKSAHRVAVVAMNRHGGRLPDPMLLTRPTRTYQLAISIHAETGAWSPVLGATLSLGPAADYELLEQLTGDSLMAMAELIKTHPKTAVAETLARLEAMAVEPLFNRRV